MPHIGASGMLGVALETTSGTYLAPQKFVPIESESLKYNGEPVDRRPIRNTPGLVGVLPGNANTEGDVTGEALSDVLPYFLHASRCTVVKTGTAPNFTYTYTPAAIAVPAKTLSISVKRGNEVFGYAGCIVGGLTLSIGDDGVLKFTANIFGLTESSQSALTPTWPTTQPFAAGQYSLQVPTATQIFDTDTYEFAFEDGPEAQYRIKTSRDAQFVKFGESSASVKLERDFETRTQYDLFKAVTAQSVTLVASKSANESIQVDVPVGYMSSYEVNLGGQGDLLRASLEYKAAIDGTGKHYQIVVKCAENIT